MKEYKLTREQIKLSKEIIEKSSFILSVNRGVGKTKIKVEKIPSGY